MIVRSIGLASALAWVDRWHSHLDRPIGGLFALAVWVDDRCVCVAVVSRPVARALDDGSTAEVTRLASDGSTRGAASTALRACVREAAARGYDRIVSYTLLGEVGACYRAARWRPTAIVRGREWSCPSRTRQPAQQSGGKVRWEAGARAAPRSERAQQAIDAARGTGLRTRTSPQGMLDV